MTLLPVNQMHADHNAWEAETALWRDQLREWQRETEQALADLSLVEQTFREHERELEVHAAAIHLKEQACRGHEHQLADAARKQDHVCTGGGHCGEARNVVHERQKHEALKKAHHTLMARWMLLFKSLQ